MRAPHACLSIRMNSVFGNGPGAAKFTQPLMFGFRIRWSVAFTKSSSWIQDTNVAIDSSRAGIYP
jgi:hypothetical protein